MDKLWFTIFGAITTFFVTWGLNTAIFYYSADKGAMRISPPVSIGGHKYQTIAIENYTSDMLDGLVLKVPAATPNSAISSSALVRLADLATRPDADARTIKVSDIPPRTTTRLFVPVPQTSSKDEVAAINPKSIGLSFENSAKLESRLQRNLIQNLADAAITALGIGVLIFATRVGREALQKKIDDLTAKTTVLSDKTDRKIDRMHGLIGKQRILLQARIRDYERELAFWRDTIRAMVMGGGGSDRDADALQRVVTEQLKTYGTRTSDLDFEAVRVASRWLHEDHEKAGAEAKLEEPQA